MGTTNKRKLEQPYVDLSKRTFNFCDFCVKRSIGGSQNDDKIALNIPKTTELSRIH